MSKISLFLSALALGLALTCLGRGVSCGSGEGHKKVSAETNARAAGGERLAKGVWGGNHMRMEVTDEGATVEHDCAHATIEQPIVTDAEGKFDAKATFFAERGGPVRQDQPLPTHPARYAGQVSGDTVTLNVTLTDTGEDAGSFTLTRGSNGRVMKCR